MRRWDLRPARDLGLAGGERLRSHQREPGLFSLGVNWAWMGAVSTYLRVAHRLLVEGRDNLPAEPPFVLIGNHSSHLDALVLASCVKRSWSHRVVPLAAGEVFFGSLPSAGFAAAALNAMPIWRQRTSSADLAFLRQRLFEDRLIYILFPEGTRSRDGAIGRFRPGIGALVAGSEVPVVPCHLLGAHAAWPPSASVPRPGKLRLRVGAPLRFADVSDDRDGAIEVAARLEAAVRGLRAGRTTPGAPC